MCSLPAGHVQTENIETSRSFKNSFLTRTKLPTMRLFTEEANE